MSAVVSRSGLNALMTRSFWNGVSVVSHSPGSSMSSGELSLFHTFFFHLSSARPTSSFFSAACIMRREFVSLSHSFCLDMSIYHRRWFVDSQAVAIPSGPAISSSSARHLPSTPSTRAQSPSTAPPTECGSSFRAMPTAPTHNAVLVRCGEGHWCDMARDIGAIWRGISVRCGEGYRCDVARDIGAMWRGG